MAEIKTLTQAPHGHMLHHNAACSADGRYIVFDYRNDETQIGRTASIGVYDMQEGKEVPIYHNMGQSIYGPGVGAASFHPATNQVVFIHGLQDANKEKPYDITRRTGVIVDMEQANRASYADCRDLNAPYFPGTLRGGTHSHMWRPDGQMISFTYNDELVELQLRMVGVMMPAKAPIPVREQPGNVQGEYYAVICSEVVAAPEWGSDEINKAFDECWLQDRVGDKPTFSLAFQGNTLTKEGKPHTEIYTCAIDEELILSDPRAVGSQGRRPQMPRGMQQKRLTHTKTGLSDLRHWLRASPDGSFIYALMKDEQGRNQILQCDRHTGQTKQLSQFEFSISSPINIDAQGQKLVFFANQQVYIFTIETKELQLLTNFNSQALPLVGAPLFHPDGKHVLFNQFVAGQEGTFVQIKMILY